MFKRLLLLLCVGGLHVTLSATQLPIQDFSSIKLKHEITKRLVKQFPSIDQNKITINLKNFMDLKQHTGNSTLVDIDFDKANSYLGNVLFDMHFIDKEGKKSKRYRLHAESSIHVIAYKTNKRLKRNAIIRDSDIDLGTLQIKHGNADYFTTKSDLIGKQTKQIVYKDTFLSNKWIESVPDIKKGEAVAIKIRNNHYEIDGHAEALESGYIGEKIRIKLNMSKKIILAKIVDGESNNNDTQKIVVLAN